MGLSASVAVLIDLSSELEQAGDLSAALRHAEEAEAAARTMASAEDLAAARIAVARVRYRLGHYEAAKILAVEALASAPPRSPVRADAWQVLGNCAADTDALALAEAHYRTAADLARETGNHRAQVAALQGLAGGAYYPRGQFDLALAAANEVFRIAAAQSRPDWLVYPQTVLCMIYQATSQNRKARAALDELARLAAPGSMASGCGLCIDACLHLDEGNLEGAVVLCGRARTVAEMIGEPWLNCSVRLAMSRYHRLAGDGPNARAWADDALAFAAHVGYRHEQGRALIERGRAAWLCGQADAAEADLHGAVAQLADLGAAFDLARARFLLAALLHEQRRSEATAAWLEAARAVVEGGFAFLLEQERNLAFPLLAAHGNRSEPELARASILLLDHLRRVPPPPLHVVTLGGLDVRQGRRHVESRSLRQRRAGELLALLLLSPGAHLTSEQVAEALFPGKAPATALILFHHATSALRRALEPELPDRFPSRYLEVEDGQITLRLPPDSCVDLADFEACCRQGRWEEAVALYGGDLLPEYRYADWTLAPRERLALLCQRALLAAAEARLAGGHPDMALDACQRLLSLEPWHEGAVSIGMRACACMNDLAGARRLYRRLEKALADDLGAAPQPELRALYRSLTPTRV